MSHLTRVSGFALSIGALCLLGAATAQAHPTRTGLYIDGGGGFEYFNLPTSDGIISSFIEPVGNTDGTFWAESGFLTLGFMDGAGTTLPDPIGRDARVKLTVRYTSGDSDQGVDTTTALGFIRINDPTTANGTFSGPPQTAFYETRLRKWDADLLYETDVPFNDMLVLTPFMGLTYSQLELDNDYTIFVNGTSISNLFSLEDDTDAYYGGIALGGDAELTLLDVLTLRAGMRADLMAVTAKMDADQVFSLGPFGAFGQTYPSESDRDLDFAARVSAGLGVGAKFGPVEIGIDGTTTYHSYVPIVQHPIRYGERTSRIEGRAAWSASALAHLTIYFGSLMPQ
jgi:hypothetical protein